MTPMFTLPSRAQRRQTIVAIWILWLAATLTRSPLVESWPVLLSGGLTIALLLTLGAQVVRNYRNGQAIADDADTSLDERQIALRNRAYLGAYRLFAGVMAVGAAYITIAVDSKWFWYPSSRFAWQTIAELILLLAMIAPSGWLAWFVADSDETDAMQLSR